MAVDLNSFAGGSLLEQFEEAFVKVLDNLIDPNTPYKDKRKIIVDISFIQNEERDDMTADISVKTKLAGRIPVSTKFAIAKDLKTGTLCAEEYGRGIKGQMSIKDYQSKGESARQMEGLMEINGQTVDTETGEVIDFRQKGCRE